MSTQKPRILYVVESLDVSLGGIPTAVLATKDILGENPYFVETLEVLPTFRRGTTSILGKAQALIRFGVGCWRLLKVCLSPNAYHAIHVHGLWLPQYVVLSLYARANDIPLISSLHGMLMPESLGRRRWKKRLAWQLYQRWILESSDALHVTSSFEYQSLEAFLKAKCVIIPFSLRRSLWCRPESRNVPKTAVLYLGRLHPIKGLDVLLKAWAQANPVPGWELWIAGDGDIKYRNKLEILSVDLSPKMPIRFLGEIESKSVPNLLQKASLFVLPSRSENQGLVVLEALSQAIPCITTTSSPWNELRTRELGWSVACTVAEVKRALDEAISLGEDRLKVMGENAREWAYSEFGPEVTGTRFRRLYQKQVADNYSNVL